MRIPRIYIEETFNTDTLQLDGPSHHYLAKVLRLTEGRELILFNGDGNNYSAIFETAAKRHCIIRIIKKAKNNSESPLNIHLGIGISRGERMDWVVQKTTELGIQNITPLFTERTEVKLQGDRLEKRIKHWQQVAISACEQAGRSCIPAIHQPIAYTDFITTHNADLKCVLHHRSAKNLETLTHTTPRTVALLIGPEGGLSDTEIDAALIQDYAPLTLGKRVLRTETAPIVALSLIQHHWGDM